MKIVDEKFNLLQRFISWREKHITDKQFILVLSLLVGLFTALAAYVLKFLVEYIKEFLTENFDSTGANWLYLVYPVVGILLTSLFIRKLCVMISVTESRRSCMPFLESRAASSGIISGRQSVLLPLPSEWVVQ